MWAYLLPCEPQGSKSDHHAGQPRASPHSQRLTFCFSVATGPSVGTLAVCRGEQSGLRSRASPGLSQLTLVATQPIPWPPLAAAPRWGRPASRSYGIGDGRSESAHPDPEGTGLWVWSLGVFCSAIGLDSLHSSISDPSTIHEKLQKRHLSFSGGSGLAHSAGSVASSAYAMGEVGGVRTS